MEDTIVNLREENQVMRDAILGMRGQRKSSIKQAGHAKSSQSNVNFILSPTKSISFTGENGLEGAEEDVTLSIEDTALSRTLQNVSTQTFDTAFVPCEACSRMQQNLLDVGASVIGLCESQGLPSALAKQKRLLKQSLMAAADVSRWTNEQSRDIERINKHLDNLYAQINPLRSDLEKSRQLNKKLQEQLSELMGVKKKVDLDLVNKEIDFNQKIDLLSLENEKSLKLLETELGDLANSKESVENSYSQLQHDNDVQKGKTEQLGMYLFSQEDSLSNR